jgi:hypothetical protein
MRRQRLSFARELDAAVVLSLCGGAAVAALAPWIGLAPTMRGAIALLGLAYVLHLLRSSGERVGRMTTIACWAVAAAAAWLGGLAFVPYVLTHVGLAWLVRCLYHRAGLLTSLADLGVSLLGAAFAAVAWQRTGSVWLALWCFFLAQAFHALIPATLSRERTATEGTDDSFSRAHRAAEAAVRRLSASPR